MADPAGWKTRAFAINIALALIGVAAYALTLSNSWGIWGVDYLISMPLWARTALVIIMVILAVPPIGLRAAALSEKVLKAAATASGKYLLFAVIIVYAAAAYFLRSFNHALGDGHNLLANIADTTVIRPTEPLEYYLHLLVFKTFFAKAGAVRAYQVLSIVAGIGLLATAWAFVRKKAAFLVALVIIASFGTTQFFFGYAEHYTFALVFGVLFLLNALRDLDAGRPSWLTILALLLAILSHLYSLVLLPAAAYLAWKTLGKKAALVALPVMAAALVSAVVFEKALVQTQIAEVFSPLIATANNPYTLFSAAHLGDMVNLACLSFPLILALPLIPFRGSRPQLILLLIALIAASIFTFAIDPSLGAARDWDLLSALAGPVMVFLIFSINKLEDESRKFKYILVAPLAAFAVFHTGGWIIHNTSMQAGYERIKHEVVSDIHYSPAYYKGYRNKSWSLIAQERYADPMESIRAGKVRYRAEPLDPANTVLLAQKYLAANDTAAAVALAERHWPDFLDSAENVVPSIGSLMMQARRLDIAEQIFEAFVSRGYMEFTVLYNLASCKDRRGQTDSAIMIYQSSFDNFSAPPKYEIEFYLQCVEAGRSEQALRGLRKMLPKMNPSSQRETEGLIRALETGNKAVADSLSALFMKRLPQ